MRTVGRHTQQDLVDRVGQENVDRQCTVETLRAYLEWVSCRYSVASSKEPPRAAHTSPSATTATDAAPLLGSCMLQNKTQYISAVQREM